MSRQCVAELASHCATPIHNNTVLFDTIFRTPRERCRVSQRDVLADVIDMCRASACFKYHERIYDVINRN